jgi:glucokinase
MAGEIGHAVLDPHGPDCVCGLRGCLEAMAAGPAIARLANDAIADGADTLLRHYKHATGVITAEDVYRAASEGDPTALGIAETVGGYLAQAIQQLVMAYDIELVVLGGGVSKAGGVFLDPVLNALQDMRSQSDLAREMIRPGMITLLEPGYDAGAWGAVALATDYANQHPALSKATAND